MRAGLGLIAVLLLAVRPATAQDDDVLLPDVSAVFSGGIYDAVVEAAFVRDVSTCRGGVQMIRIPSFGPEMSAGVCWTRDGFVAYTAAPLRNLHYAGYDSTGVDASWSLARAQAVEIDRAEVRIDSALAARVAGVWARALRTTRQPPDPDPTGSGMISTDGEIVYYASFAQVRLTAHAWNPRPGSLPGAMVALGDAIEAVAQRRAPAGSIGRACDRLEAALAIETSP